MAIKKWIEMTSEEIEALDKEKTVVILPLGTMGSAVKTRTVGGELLTLEAEAEKLMNTVNNDAAGPMAELEATILPPLWFGSAPGPSLAGTITVPRAVYKDVVKGVCQDLKDQGIKFVALIVRDRDLEKIANGIAKKLNPDEPQAPWVRVYNPPFDMDGLGAGDVGANICIFFTLLWKNRADQACVPPPPPPPPHHH